MGESISEATVASWRKQPGESFQSGDILVELETDKVTMEVPAPSAGVLKEILKNSGTTVHVNETLGIIEEGAMAPAASTPTAPTPTPAPAPQSAPSPEKKEAHPNPEELRNFVLPPGARRLAEENKINPANITGTGKHQQVTKADVISHMEKTRNQTPARTGDRETVVPMSKLRQKIAERLVMAQHTAAILTTFNEVDMSSAMEMRAKYKDKFKDTYGVGLGFMSIFTKAVIDALKLYPAVNAEIRGTDIVYKNYYDVGVAVGGPKGLVVPIIRNADQMSFADIEKEISRLAGRVRESTISIEELQNGTFTISNGGIYGSMLSTPILNPPQVGILGMHNIVKRAIVVGDEIKNSANDVPGSFL